ncbi:hypothetical protein L1049_000466 [Liquidambar formosana]|uniref:Pentatricopeptide repeat-containing protein n=1 Tax=Liquidambar formosana TaxID=63359 RepID=A0AAP0N917_LIQFO
MEAVSLLTVSTLKPKRSRVCLHQKHPASRTLARKIIWRWKQEGSVDGKDACVECASLIQILSRKRMPLVAQKLFLEMKSEGFQPDYSTLSALMLCYADNGLFPQAQAIWDEILNSSFMPDIQIVSELIDAYGKMGHFDEVTRILHQVSSRYFNLTPAVCSLAISFFGKRGQLDMMENALKELASSGFLVDSATGNALIRYYSIFGSLTEMEAAYGRLKRSRILIEREGIRAMAFAVYKRKKVLQIG